MQRLLFVVAGSNLETDAKELVFGFEDVTGKAVNVFGGTAGDDYTFAQQYVFTNGRESDKGVVVIALDESKIKIKGPPAAEKR